MPAIYPTQNKIVYGGRVLIDLTADTVTADKLAYGYTAHDKAGVLVTGTMEEPVEATSAEVTAAVNAGWNGE